VQGRPDFGREDGGITDVGSVLATDVVARFRLTTYPSARSCS
jgi:hypothetical protein